MCYYITVIMPSQNARVQSNCVYMLICDDAFKYNNSTLTCTSPP